MVASAKVIIETAAHGLVKSFLFFPWLSRALMDIITLDETKANLPDLVHNLLPGQVLTIIENDRPVARLMSAALVRQRPPRPRPPSTGVPKVGKYEGLLVVPADFKEPLEEMREYME
jgi:antitoxin (DNA-binding transcriptional repressor) of toxin-antitoxin stability system